MSGQSSENGGVGGKTVPQMTMSRTMTVSRRPWTLIVIFAVALLFVIIFYFIHAFSKSVTPQGTVDKLITAFGKGDVDTLLSDPELNFKERALSDIEKRGLEEYNRVDNAFEKCIETGMEKYESLRGKVISKGEEAYRSLSREEQQYIRSLSKNLWIFRKGMESLDEAELKGADDPYVFIDEEKSENFISKLGADARNGEKNGQEKKAGGKKKGRKKGTKAEEKGREIYEDLKSHVYEAGHEEFMELPREERNIIENESKMNFVIQNGIEILTEEERALVTGPEMFAENADEKREAVKLCTPFISDREKELIKGKDYRDFATKKEVYIEQTGRENYEKFLKTIFEGCEYKIVRTRAFGKSAFDLFRVSKVSIDVEWQDCGGVETFIPSTFMLELDDGKWRLLMEEGSELDEEPVKEPEEEAESEEGGGVSSGGEETE